MAPLLSALSVATVLLGWVVRDLLVDHGRVVRELDRRGAATAEPDAASAASDPLAR